MPMLLHKNLTRRGFLRTAAVSVGAIATLGVPRTFGESSAESTRWAFLSDTHVPEDITNEYRGFFPYENMKMAVQQVLDADPEGAIITGDLARLEGFPGNYAMLKTLTGPLVEKLPLGMTLGNHDHRANFLDAFANHPGNNQSVKGKHVLVIEKPPVRLILLDSLLFTNQVPGLLGKAQREWLSSYLRSADKTPTLLLFHHTLGDEDGSLLDTERLFAAVIPHTAVKALIFGHSHVYQHLEHLGVHLINLPAVGYNFRDVDPVGWIEADLTARGGSFTLHAIGGNRQDDGKTISLEWRA